MLVSNKHSRLPAPALLCLSSSPAFPFPLHQFSTLAFPRLQGAEKLIISKMLVENSNRRTFPVDRHAGVAIAGACPARLPACLLACLAALHGYWWL